MKKVVVRIYTRPGCHLCEEAKAAIRTAGCEGDFVLEEINIDHDPELLERYQSDIPVVLFDGNKVFKHRVDADEFKRKLHRLGRRSS